jgi:hypothetical protein
MPFHFFWGQTLHVATEMFAIASPLDCSNATR